MSAIDPKQAEQEELVAEWLRATPGFFERYANLLNEIRLKHPHEDRAISLQERQMTLLRTQNQELNRRLSEMLHFGSRNDKTQQSLVAWLLRLMGANTKADVESAVTAGLAEVFATGFAVGLVTALAVALTAGLAAALGAAGAGFLLAGLATTFLATGLAGFLDLRSTGMKTPRLQRNEYTAPQKPGAGKEKRG